MSNKTKVLSVLTKDVWKTNAQIAKELNWHWPSGCANYDKVGPITHSLFKEEVIERRIRPNSCQREYKLNDNRS